MDELAISLPNAFVKDDKKIASTPYKLKSKASLVIKNDDAEWEHQYTSAYQDSVSAMEVDNKASEQFDTAVKKVKDLAANAPANV